MTFVRAGHREAWDEFAMSYYVRTETYCTDQGFESHVVSELWIWLLDNCWQLPLTHVWEWLCQQAARVASLVQVPAAVQLDIDHASHLIGPPHDFGEVDD